MVTAFIIIPILYYLAPDMAIFYSVPDLSLIIRALSLIVIFESLSNVHIALLTKRINFKTQLKANLISYSISGAIGIIAAYNGFGIWSLVLQLVGHSLLQTILLWLLHDWRPSLVFSISSLKDMFPFGSRLFVSGILDTVFNNIYFVVIGKVFTVADVGYYSRAKGLQELPVSSLSMVVGRVTFPVFCEVQDDKAKLKRGCASHSLE
ncbi:MAG: oligosaccharide flippase family protein [Candidatus Sedimenticola sp. (ex Thyasira tokunagai)]